MLLHELFTQWAKTNPSNVALQFEDEVTLTYAELDQRANQYAHYLANKGIGLQSKIAVRLNRSAEQVIVLLAIFKLGAIYVPIAPPDRLLTTNQSNQTRDILDDIQPDIFITHEDIPLTDFNDQLHVILLNSTHIQNEIEQCSAEKPAIAELTDQHIAYIIYSSGTTGKPKGIPIRHGGLDYWAKVQDKLFSHISHDSRILGFISIGFDAHIWEYLMAWVKGASIHLASEDTCRNPVQLVNFMEKHKVTDATLIPTVLRALNLTESLPTLKNAGLQAIYSTGEKCTRELVAIFEQNGVALWNCYGPTEATFGISVKKTQLSDLGPNDRVPIGKPYGDEVKVHILDDQNKPITDNGVGSLYIESPYLTTGYVNRPQETQNNIVNIQISGQTSIRVFRTGDKVYLNNGEIFYYGRINEITPVKINGQYVNLMEVEETIRKQQIIQDVCVIAKERQDNTYLIAYLVTKPQQDFNQSAFRQTLAAHLKSIAIPSYFMTVAELPKTANGKIDRRALEVREVTDPIASDNGNSQKLLPRNSLEEKIAKIWQQILGYEESSIEIDFVTLGGNSNHLMQLIGKINLEFNGLTIAVSSLLPLDQLTIQKLANIIYEQYSLVKLNEITGKIREGNNKYLPLFLIAPITGEAMVTYSELVKSLKYDCTYYALNSLALLSSFFNLSTSVESIARVNIAAIKKVQPQGPYRILAWSFGCTVAWEMARQLEEKDEEVAFLGLIDGVSPKITSTLSNADYNRQLAELITELLKSLGSPVSDSLIEQIQALKVLSHDEQVIAAFKLIDINSEQAKPYLAIAQSHLLASNNYQPDVLKTTNPTVFTCKTTIDKLPSAIDNHLAIATLGWALSHQFVITAASKLLSGDHFSIIRQPKELAEQIDHYLTGQSKRQKIQAKTSFGNSDTTTIQLLAEKMEYMLEMLALQRQEILVIRQNISPSSSPEKKSPFTSRFSNGSSSPESTSPTSKKKPKINKHLHSDSPLQNGTSDKQKSQLINGKNDNFPYIPGFGMSKEEYK